MNLPALQDLGVIPFSTVSATLMYQVLGPTARYLGTKEQDISKKGIENLERIFLDAHKKISDDRKDCGEVPPRVLKGILNEGAFVDDSIAAGYLGGVLASSKADSNRDDRGVVINAMISRLSVFQIRLHYVIYSALNDLLRGANTHFGEFKHLQYNQLHFGTFGLLAALGFSEKEMGSEGFNLDAILAHSLYGLSREELFSEWKFHFDEGLKCSPTPTGAELFLWASGAGSMPPEYFFDRSFAPAPVEEVRLIQGRNYVIPGGEDEDDVTIDGYDLREYCGQSCLFEIRMHATAIDERGVK